MTFANVCANQEQLTLLSQLLLTAFPGCTIHQSRDPMRAMQRLSCEKLDAVFADADTCSDLVHILRKQNSNASVYLLCRQNLPPEQTGDAHAIITYPITKQKIKTALQIKPREIREGV